MSYIFRRNTIDWKIFPTAARISRSLTLYLRNRDTILKINKVISQNKFLLETQIFIHEINSPNLWNTNPGTLLTTTIHYTLPAPFKNVPLGKINCSVHVVETYVGHIYIANHIINPALNEGEQSALRLVRFRPPVVGKGVETKPFLPL
jgi:hypothetical protein